MANQKFITVESGNKRLKTATSVSVGLTDAGKVMCLDETGKISDTLLPDSVGLNTYSAITSVVLTPYQMVAVFNNAGVPNLKLADASTVGCEAIGYVKEGFNIGDVATVFLEGSFSYTGATVGQSYFLSDTVAGDVTSVAPINSGSFYQFVGRCYDLGKIRYEQSDDIVYID